LKKILLFSFFIILFVANTNAQDVKKHKVDTTYTIDSIWRNDTLFLVRTMHIKVIIPKDTAKIVEKTPYLYNDLLNYSFLAPNEIKTISKEEINFFSNTKIHFQFDYGNVKYFKKSKNIFLDSTILPISSSSYGFLFEKSTKYFNYFTGFFYTNLTEKFIFSDSWFKVDTSYTEEVLTNNYWDIDTIWFLNLDSLLVGDTVWVPYYDSTYITEFDTITHQHLDTTNFSKKYNNINKLYFVEFPILLSYNIILKKVSLNFVSGVFIGFFINPKYNIFLPFDYGILSATFPSIFYSFYQSISFEYQISRKIGIQLGVYCKIPLSSYFNIYETNRKPISYGFSVGLNYKLK